MKYYTIVKQPNCKWCDKAVELLVEHRVTYQIVDISNEPWVKTVLRKADLLLVPQVFDEEGNLIGGYTELKAKLERT